MPGLKVKGGMPREMVLFGISISVLATPAGIVSARRLKITKGLPREAFRFCALGPENEMI